MRIPTTAALGREMVWRIGQLHKAHRQQHGPTRHQPDLTMKPAWREIAFPDALLPLY